MADFGICENPDCKLSYDSLILAGLFGRIDAVNGMEKRKVDFSRCRISNRLHRFFSSGLNAPSAVNSCIELLSPRQICRQNPKNISSAQN
jgi:hypothetical protein